MMKRKTKLHRDTLRHLTAADLRSIAGGPLRSGRLTCGGETVDTCETFTKACFEQRTFACTDGYYSC